MRKSPSQKLDAFLENRDVGGGAAMARKDMKVSVPENGALLTFSETA